jgi:hypothetical protein
VRFLDDASLADAPIAVTRGGEAAE